MRIRKIALLAVLMGLTNAAYAVAEGMYFGVQAGSSKLNNTTQDITVNTTGTTYAVKPTNTGMGGRLSLGYQAGDYFGMEMGWTYYTPSKYKVTNLTGNTLCNDPTIKQSTLDLLGKGVLPFSTSGFNVFGKAGIAIGRQTKSGTLTSNSGACGSSNSSSTAVRPAAGIGAGYDINQNWVMDVSYNQVFSGGGQKTASLVALGLSYHIVNKRCGQFLC